MTTVHREICLMFCILLCFAGTKQDRSGVYAAENTPTTGSSDSLRNVTQTREGYNSSESIAVGIVVLKEFGGRATSVSPYYVLGSGVTLVCYAEGTTGLVSYQWSSTSEAFFAYNSTSMFNKKQLLSSADAGIHTCSVSDESGSTAHAALEMKFNGAVLYVARSFDFTGILPANNSLLVHYPSSCSGCLIEFYCFSNSTLSAVGEVVFPDGNAYNNDTTLDGDDVVERENYAMLRVQTTNEHSGIFTCKLPDSHGNTIEISVGIYPNRTVPPAIDILFSGYTDLTNNNDTTAMAEIECYTMNSPPTHVVWLKNGEEIELHDDNYETLQVVTDRRNSHYQNILVVRDVLGVMNVTYTCKITNSAGSTQHNITIDLPVTTNANIVATHNSEYEGDIITLTCEGALHPSKFIPQLNDGSYIIAEWMGPEGVPLTEQNRIVVGSQRHTTSGVVRSLTLNGTSYAHAGIYTCQVALNFTNSLSHMSVAKYHLLVRKNITVVDREESLLEQGPTDDLMCVWNGSLLPRMEWLFIGDFIAPLTHTNSSWDMTHLQCMVWSSDRFQHGGFFRIKADVIGDINVESSSDYPTAGENLTLICSVVSDTPVMMRWIGPDGEDASQNTSALLQKMINASLSISFQPLHTSHGGNYTCISSVVSSVQVVEQQYFIAVHIPAPTLTITTQPNGTIFANTLLSLVCIVTLDERVDTPVTVNTRWNGPLIFFGNNRITVRDQESETFIFKSILSFTPVVFSDSGLYTCIVNVIPCSGHDLTVSAAPWTTQELNLIISLNVRIEVIYNPPPDFTLQSPPFYRPASSVTLICVAEDGSTPVNYQWSSTCSSCFASSGLTDRITTDILKSTDAGTHTCTVTDAEGNTGYASTEMKLIGAGVYVTQSEHISNSAISNNTALHACQTCGLGLFCYSNSTTTYSRAVIRFTNNRDISYQSPSYYRRLSVQRVNPSGIQLEYHYSRYYGYPNSGIYICRIPDSHGTTIEFSIGLYFGIAEVPSIYSTSYTDLTSDPSTHFLAKLECRSQRSIPTNVTWWRNGIEVDIDNNSYQIVQKVVQQSGSYFENTLLLRDLFGALGNHSYACSVENHFGNDSGNVTFSKKVSEIHSSSLETLYGDILTLTCQLSEPPSGYALKVHMEWWGPNKGIGDDIVLEMQESAGGSFTRDLVFEYLRPTMDGVYTCQTTIEVENNTEKIVETNMYHLEVLGRIVITGNELPLLAGLSHEILCTWKGSDTARMTWHLQGLKSVPLVSTENSSDVVLYLDSSATGLNGCTFICRIVTLQGDTYEEHTTVHVKAMSVDIQVMYQAPSDFSLPSPPYYRPASSITLTCIVHGASEPVHYQWSSTSANSFAQRYSPTSPTLVQSKLTSADAGLHTCTVTDANGTIVSQSTQMILIGAGMFVQESRNIRLRGVVNNTALRSSYRYQVDIYFYSNATYSAASIISPNGIEYFGGSGGGFSVQQLLLSSGLRFIKSRYSNPLTGIYTCRIPNSHGKMLEINFGLYSSSIGIPSVSTPEFSRFNWYTNSDINSPALAMVSCNSSGFPPTRVVWEKDNIAITEDDNAYQAMQRVVNRRSSMYTNSLIISDILGVLGTHVYTCSIITSAGNVSRSIQIENSVTPTVTIVAPPEQTYKLQHFLTCTLSLPPNILVHIIPYTMIVWSRLLHGRLITETEVQEAYNDRFSIKRNLRFSSLNESHNGVYICQIFIQFPGNDRPIYGEASHIIQVKALDIVVNMFPLTIGISSDLVCTTKETHVVRMELRSNTYKLLNIANASNSIMLTLDPDYGLNETNITCVATTSDGLKYEDYITLIVKDFSHDIAIEKSSESAVAGEVFNFTCIVISDSPVILSWTNSRGEPVGGNGITLSPKYVEGKKSTIQLSFDQLRTSHGGQYICNSKSNVSSTKNYTSLGILLEVEIAPPVVMVSRLTEGQVKLSSIQTLKCEVRIIEEVDVPIITAVRWVLPRLFQNESKLTASNTSDNNMMFSSFLTINDYSFSDSGNYSCIASAIPTANVSGVKYKSVYTVELTHVYTNLNVSIYVDYATPSDFTLPSPPYYRPASSVTLWCTTYGAIGNVSYQWTSTEVESFAHGAAGENISQNILTAFDAGIHRCTVTDELGNTGSGQTEMELFGAGIYIQHSTSITNSSVPNNTAVYFQNYCYSFNCRISFYCLSNSTSETSSATFVYYDGNRFPAYTSHYLTVERVFNSSGLHAYNSQSYVYRGVYTCELPDANGNILNLSIGIYDRYPGQPYAYRISYNNLIEDTSNTALATIECRTQSYPPTWVVWQKDGVEISVDGRSYDTLQVVTSRSNSYFRNILIVKDVVGIVGTPLYTCVVGNSAGNTSRSVRVSINIRISLSVDIHAGSIRVGDNELTYGTEYTIVCVGEITSSKSLRLEDYTGVEWRDNIGPVISRENIKITTMSNSSGIYSILSFEPLSNGHDRLYTCSMTMDIPTTDIIHHDSSDYRLILDVAYFQLKFEVVSCTALYQAQISEQLENDIKESLSRVINQQCKCGFLTSMIDHGEFNCYTGNIIGYRARIVGGSDTHSSSDLIEILKQWQSTDGTFVYTEKMRRRVWVDKSCPLHIDSLTAANCEAN